jgi:hypothetical protein
MQIKRRNKVEITLGASSPAQPAFTLPCPMSMTTADTSSPPNIAQSPAHSYFSQGRTDGDGARSSRVFRLPLTAQSRCSEEPEVWSARRRGLSGGGAEQQRAASAACSSHRSVAQGVILNFTAEFQFKCSVTHCAPSCVHTAHELSCFRTL